MAITLTDVNRIAHLAHIELSQYEAEYMLEQLNQFFSLVEQMQAVDTTKIEPLSYPTQQIEKVKLRLQEDIVTEHIHRDENQRCAPAVQDGLYLVPKVIE
ncbi:Asp-tRNA(Asn)/Glu-tRNA(Gln) amidotransferase subunit GatC [Candidatus Vallotia tarda]|uniref:Aspartyl/glutamyl-tRNA(Asn/Gln) amidotransferase subunit C n=1 Tax=Candidatus Vallotiella hemipterorum TaxID=1177213 RepID=A0A916JRV4_9BURK|nr:Asp-tRNA(Asn)/Glu-tRNA(Gln) amidotransferase subunit GatC [Candidatus Vallotia tarda]CAG7595260.1 Aspartyl/glutamyl-tRNA(Asn/Gln) amidotransferasesubunit C [Candidatus Vallotia tarda]